MSLAYKLLGIPRNIDEFLERERQKYLSTSLKIEDKGASDPDPASGINNLSIDLLVVSEDGKRKFRIERLVSKQYVLGDSKGYSINANDLYNKLVEEKKKLAEQLTQKEFKLVSISPDPRNV